MQRRGEFRVSVTKDYLVFASAHFITFAGHRCEGLHGHNYRARVTRRGRARTRRAGSCSTSSSSRSIMRRLCDEIDHLVLLPLESIAGPGRRGRRDRDGGGRREAALRRSRAATARCCRFRTRPSRCSRSC